MQELRAEGIRQPGRRALSIDHEIKIIRPRPRDKSKDGGGARGDDSIRKQWDYQGRWPAGFQSHFAHWLSRVAPVPPLGAF